MLVTGGKSSSLLIPCITWRCWSGGHRPKGGRGGFDFARPLEDWDLPVSFGILRRRLEAELGGLGTREFIKTLRLLEHHPLSALKQAVQRALEIGATSPDAIRLILDYQQEEPVRLFSLDGRPHLKLVHVQPTDVSAYQLLLFTSPSSSEIQS